MIDAGPPPLVFPKPAIIRPASADLLRYRSDPVTAFLPGLMPAMTIAAFSSGAPDITITNDGSFSETLANMAIGMAFPGRVVVGRVHGWRSGVTGRTLSGALIGGVSANVLCQATGSSGSNCNCVAILAAIVPTGATATVSLTWSGSMTGQEVALTTLEGCQAATADAAHRDTDFANGSRTAFSGTVNQEAGGITLAVVASRESDHSYSWSNLTEDSDTYVDGLANRSSAKDLTAEADEGVTVTATASSSQQRGAFAIVSLR